MAVLTWFSCKTMTAILYFGGQKSVHNDGLVTIIMAALKREVLYYILMTKYSQTSPHGQQQKTALYYGQFVRPKSNH